MDVKIIFAGISAIVLFLVGLFAGRASGHKQSRIGTAIDGEGTLQDHLGAAQGRESDLQDGIADLEGRVNETAAGVSDLEAGISDTDRLAQRLKERNDLE